VLIKTKIRKDSRAIPENESGLVSIEERQSVTPCMALHAHNRPHSDDNEYLRRHRFRPCPHAAWRCMEFGRNHSIISLIEIKIR
jgi:hypothetical protein